ncbi:MAG: iron-containing alcohol dehydrogenase [Chloroflexota bacterium]|nr:iron-containing alcohol dehydrogenase [Chloroflexota bacterium]
MNFEFATAGRIVFGAGKRAELPKLIEAYGARRVFCVIGSTQARVQPILDLITATGALVETFSITHEPDLASIGAGMTHLRDFRPDLIVAVGGGSVLDAGKAFAALEANPGDLIDYLEVIGAGKPLVNPVRLPLIAMPTTAGTGSEVTRNAVIASPEHRLKVSLRHHSMLPAVALVDPELTLGLPAHITAYTGMDALVQLIEPMVSIAATPITDALTAQGLSRGAPALLRCFVEPDNLEARTDMAFASLMGGMALANAKLGAVHGFAGVIGGMFDAPHGALCARLLPPVIAANREALLQRQPDSSALRRLANAEAIIERESAMPDFSGDFLLDWAWSRVQMFQIPPLASYGIQESHLDEIAQKSAGSSSMKGNPIVLTHDELMWILQQAL